MMNFLRFVERQKGLHAVVISSTLAVLVGINTAMFCVVNTLYIRPLPYPNAPRTYVVNYVSSGADQPGNGQLSWPDYVDLSSKVQSFSGVGLFAVTPATLGVNGHAVETQFAPVSSRFFTVLGSRPILGRTFGDVEEANGDNVAVISDDLWRRYYSSEPSAIGKVISIFDRPYTIIGVMPPRFEFPSAGVQVWTNVGSLLKSGPIGLRRRDFKAFRAIAHLQNDRSLKQALAELAVVSKTMAADHPDSGANREFRVVTLREFITGNVRTSIWALYIGITLLLFIGCINISNLILASSLSKAPEMGIRVALGASRRQLVKAQLRPYLQYVLWGGVAGLVLSSVLLDLVRSSQAAILPLVSGLRIQGIAFLYAMGTAAVCIALASVAPAIIASRIQPADALRAGDNRYSSTPLVSLFLKGLSHSR